METNIIPALMPQNEIQDKGVVTFSSEMFGDSRVALDDDGDPWFCLADVCQSLGLSAKEVRRRLNDEVFSTHPIVDNLGRTQMALFVNEDGLYDTILDSRKPKAKEFRKWVTKDILPSLRKTGSYSVHPRSITEEYVRAKTYITDYFCDRLRLNDASRLGMYQQLASEFGLTLPAYVPSKGIVKSATVLLKDIGSSLSAQKFNNLLVEQGYLEILSRPSSNGEKQFKSITPKGSEYGENQQSPKNQKETQPMWYAARFKELHDLVMSA